MEDGTTETQGEMKYERAYRSTIKARGWTDGMIDKYLGEPDEYVTNQNYKSGPMAALFLRQRVLDAEARPEIAEEISKVLARRAQMKAKTKPTPKDDPDGPNAGRAHLLWPKLIKRARKAEDIPHMIRVDAYNLLWWGKRLDLLALNYAVSFFDDFGGPAPRKRIPSLEQLEAGLSERELADRWIAAHKKTNKQIEAFVRNYDPDDDDDYQEYAFRSWKRHYLKFVHCGEGYIGRDDLAEMWIEDKHWEDPQSFRANLQPLDIILPSFLRQYMPLADDEPANDNAETEVAA